MSLPVLLHLRVVGGHQKKTAALTEFLQNRNGDSHSLRRVRAGTQFVQQHQTLLVDRPKNLINLADMGRKCGQVVGDILPVPDVAQHLAVHGDIRLLAGHVETGAGHQTQQAHRLHGHRLAPGVWPGDNNSPDAAANLKVQRHTFLLPEHGMSGLFHPDIPLRVQLRLYRSHSGAEFGLCKDKVQQNHHPDVFQNLRLMLRNPIHQRVEDSPLLRVLLNPAKLQVLPQLRHRLRLDKQGGAGGGFVHQHSRYLGFVLLFHRNADSPAAVHHEGVRHIGLAGPQRALRLLLDFALQRLNLPPDIPQSVGGVIVDSAATDRAGNLLLKLPDLRQIIPVKGKTNLTILPLLQIHLHPPHGHQEKSNLLHMLRQ